MFKAAFYMDDAFEVLSKLNVYVYGVRTIPAIPNNNNNTKLNTFFGIALVWKRKRGNEKGSRLHFCKIFLSAYREVLWTQ